MKLNIFLTFIAICASNVLSTPFIGKYLSQDHYKFIDFVKEHNKNYSDEDLPIRFDIFRDNLRKIERHNTEGHSWTMKMNQFGDLTSDEFKTQNTEPFYRHRSRNEIIFNSNSKDLPNEIDWVSKGAVTAVKNQGQCGSCWAFSSTGSIEGAYFLNKGSLVSLSEQQLVDCSTSYGNQGCNGGLFDPSFQYVKDHGICSENDYQYTGSDGSCKTCKTVTKVDSYVDVQSNNETALLHAVSVGPVSIAAETDKLIFQFYSTGVLDSTSCGVSLDHGLLVVGYGTLNGKDYWKVKNSWGSTWGDKGYLLIGRNIKGQPAQGICGVLSEPSYPVINSKIQ